MCHSNILLIDLFFIGVCLGKNKRHGFKYLIFVVDNEQNRILDIECMILELFFLCFSLS